MTASTLRLLRRLHLYLGIFFAPAIIFFAFSGILQTYGLHEAHDGQPAPPAWIRVIASLHQHQRLYRPERPHPAGLAATGVDGDGHGDDGDHEGVGVGAGAGDRGGGGRGASPGGYPAGLVALKLFTGIMGLGLVIASGLGIAIALATRSTRRVSAVMLVLGVALPAAFILA